MLDNYYGITLIYQTAKYSKEHFYVLEMKSCGGFIKNIECIACVSACKFCRKFETLAFAAAESGTLLSELKVSEPYIF